MYIRRPLTAQATTLFCISFLTKISFLNGMENDIAAVLNDIIDNEAEPTNVFVKTCWSLYHKTKFMKKSTAQVAFIDDFMYKLPIDLSPNNVMFVVDLDCDWSSDFVNGVNVNQTFFSHPYRWLIYGSNSSNTKLVENINNALPDSNIILANWNGMDSTCDLVQFYKTEPFSETIYEPFGYWSKNTGFVNLRNTKILSRRRRDLRGKVIQGSVVILNNDSINHLTDYRDKNTDSVTKVTYMVVNYVLDAMNSSKNFTFTDTWGYLDKKTNVVNGMLGALLHKTADIGSTPCFVTVERIGVLEFVSMVTPTTTKFIFRAPPLSFITNIYYLPFDVNVWLSLVALVIISCFVIYITYRFSNVRSPPLEQLRISDIALFGISSICQMGSHREPKYLSGKISTVTTSMSQTIMSPPEYFFQIFFVLALIFVYTSYTANIVSLLQSTTKTIKTLQELYNSGIGFGVEDTPYNRYFFSLSRPGTVQRAIYEKKIIPPKKEARFMNLTYGVSRMRNGFFAFHSEPGTAYTIIEDTFYEHEKCGLIEIDYLGVVEPWLVMQKHSPYKEIIKVLFFKAREHGLQSREVSRIYTKRPICVSHGQFESLRLIDCQIVMMILAYGFIFSFFIFIIEKIIHARSVGSKLCLN